MPLTPVEGTPDRRASGCGFLSTTRVAANVARTWARSCGQTGAIMATTKDGRPTASPARARPSRRDLMKQASATAALFSALKAAFPAGAHAQTAAGPEVSKAILGYVALIDASALVIAKEKGLFAKHGMPDVEVAKQASWGATRDNIVLGSEKYGIDGAHILTPMPYLIATGKVTQNNLPTPMYLWPASTSTPRPSRSPTNTGTSRSPPMLHP